MREIRSVLAVVAPICFVAPPKCGLAENYSSGDRSAIAQSFLSGPIGLRGNIPAESLAIPPAAISAFRAFNQSRAKCGPARTGTFEGGGRGSHRYSCGGAGGK